MEQHTQNVWEVLYTTRAMRRLQPDPIPPEVIARIVDAGIRAPSGGNSQAWRFLTVTDRATTAELGTLYREGLQRLYSTVYAAPSADAPAPDDRRQQTVARVQRSAQWLADHFDDVPLLVFGFAPGGSQSGPSIYPALWSMCLAARALGVGSTITTILGMFEAEVGDLLGVPPESDYAMAGCLPMGYPTGRWGVAERKPSRKVAYGERWGEAPSWAASDGPLWTPEATG